MKTTGETWNPLNGPESSAPASLFAALWNDLAWSHKSRSGVLWRFGTRLCDSALETDNLELGDGFFFIGVRLFNFRPETSKRTKGPPAAAHVANPESEGLKPANTATSTSRRFRPKSSGEQKAKKRILR